MDLNYTSVTEHIIGASDNNDASKPKKHLIDDVSDTEEESAFNDTSDTENNQPHVNYSPNDPMDDLLSHWVYLLHTWIKKPLYQTKPLHLMMNTIHPPTLDLILLRNNYILYHWHYYLDFMLYQ